ncbi:hypothetical protein ACIBEJ_22680 [Nonomuraea sp. NPDC050790]|uniref:hypothetical protein n=1 Tax=Nonomuraea sp. NPDC050790 TaxID=3364371 RepID=UPI0037BCA10C
MAFLARLFRRSTGLDQEREDAHQQGVRDARQHALHEFTDPDCQPAYLGEVRAMARERIARLDRELADVRTGLLREAGAARQAVLRMTVGGAPPAPPNGTRAANGRGDDEFITIAEARRRRAERRRAAEVEDAAEQVYAARAEMERLAREWDGAVLRRNHDVEQVHAWAQRMIAAYRSGVMRAHPRREEIPPLWKGEVTAMDTAAPVAGDEELGGLLEEVERRVELWQAEVTGRHELPTTHTPELTAPPTSHPAKDQPADPGRADPEGTDQTDSGKAGYGWADPGRADPEGAEQAGYGKAGYGWGDRGRADAGGAEQGGSGRSGYGWGNPGGGVDRERAEPGRVDPGTADPVRGDAGRAGSEWGEAGGAEGGSGKGEG